MSEHITYIGVQIRIVETQSGFGATMNNKILEQFENPLEHYWFSNAQNAKRAAQQLIDANSFTA